MHDSEKLNRQLNVIEDNLLAAVNELDNAIFNMCKIMHEDQAIKVSKLKSKLNKIVKENYNPTSKKLKSKAK